MMIGMGVDYRFENGSLCANIAGWGETQSSDQTSAQVACNVSIQIRQHQHLK